MPVLLEPMHVLVATTVVSVVVARLRPIDDIDSFWHVTVGSEILQGVPFDRLGAAWLADAPPHAWRTSQWLSEVAMAFTVDHLGWGGLVAGQALLNLCILLTLGLTTLRGRPVALAVPVFCLAAFQVASVSQARPQTASLIFVPLVAAACQRIWADERTPPWWIVAGLCAVWGNVHGLWVLAPAAFALTWAVVSMTTRRPIAGAGRQALTLLAASFAGLANPVGIQSLLLPLTLRGSTSLIAEWQPTTLWMTSYLGFGALVLLILAVWARSSQVSGPEVVWVLAWVVFAVMAHRNVCPATLLIAPVGVQCLSRAWSPVPRQRSSRERRGLSVALVVCIGLGIAVIGLRATALKPLAETQPVAIARELGRSASPLRVLNDYNSSGPLIAFSGGRAELAIDGRADLWGNAAVARVNAVGALGKNWRTTMTAFRPDALVIRTDGPLDELLQVAPSGWQRTLVDRDFVLWLRDESGGALTPAATP